VFYKKRQQFIGLKLIVSEETCIEPILHSHWLFLYSRQLDCERHGFVWLFCMTSLQPYLILHACFQRTGINKILSLLEIRL